MTAKPKVLIVDDSRLMHRIIESRLSEDRLEFHSAFDGNEAMLRARMVEPDIILLDVEMPAPDGFEVCRKLKDDPALSHIPVIFISGAASTEEKVRGLNLGAIDYVTKPFDEAELQARVRASLRNKELLDLLAKKAMIDGLTGLWNRGYLNQRLDQELSYSRRHQTPTSCIMLDVDHFKSINDTHGHGVGDMVLKGIAGVIQQLSRREDIPCRYGGEEFAILARDTDGAGAMTFAERLRTGVEAARFSLGSHSVAVTCSLGVSDSTDGVEHLVDRADQALYESKKLGRNRSTRFHSAVAAG